MLYFSEILSSSPQYQPVTTQHSVVHTKLELYLEYDIFQILHIRDGCFTFLIVFNAADLLLEKFGLLSQMHIIRLTLIQQLKCIQY